MAKSTEFKIDDKYIYYKCDKRVNVSNKRSINSFLFKKLRGVPISTVSKLAGHSSVDTTVTFTLTVAEKKI